MDQLLSTKSLTQRSFAEGISHLTRVDPDIAKKISDLGKPTLYSREPGFPTLIHIILEQQVSLASAKAAFIKLEKASGQITPERFLEFNDTELKAFGFSRQKTLYCRGLSDAIINGDIDLGKLEYLDDTAARNKLMKLKGIGPWTADIYLLVALKRPDIWPSGDLALAKAVQDIKKLPSKPNAELLGIIADRWKPWRAVAARLLWHYNLN